MAQVLRVPQVDLAAILLEQTAQIDIRIPSYEASTRNFLKALVNYKNHAIATISERRKNQALEKKKIQDKLQSIETEINECKLKEIATRADLERESEERKEAELSVAAFKRQLASLREQVSAREAEVSHYRAVTHSLRQEKEEERSILKQQASRLPSELLASEHWLSCSVEGIERDRLLFQFREIDELDPDRVHSFVLEIAGSNYKVITSSPHLPVLSMLVDSLNKTGDIYDFVKQVRKSYVKLCTS